VIAAWKKLYPKETSDAASWLVSRQGVASYYEMWVTVQEISRAMRHVRAKRATTCMAEVYGWLARIHLDGRPSVVEEVSEWDISGLEPRFAIYQQCLLGDNSSVINMIRQRLGEPGITKYEIYTDPIFAEVKEEVLAPYMSEAEHEAGMQDRSTPAADTDEPNNGGTATDS
jgi:hypothetical protein